MIPNELKCLGLKDMAEEQVLALVKVLGHALTLADDCGDMDTFDEVFEDCNDLVILLGGGGITLSLQPILRD